MSERIVVLGEVGSTRTDFRAPVHVVPRRQFRCGILNCLLPVSVIVLSSSFCVQIIHGSVQVTESDYLLGKSCSLGLL